ncbi:MAG: FAD synthetase family protein [Clostridia bacterium]|nr:FAD synthetase family protein [Clostridia bacterium]
MRIFRSEAEYDLGKSVVALGMFDGVHIGHQALIRRAREMAGELGAACVVRSFDRHPLSVLKPERAPKQLMSLEEKLEKMGVDGVLVEEFTPEFAATDALVFLENMVRRLHAAGIVAGFNYSFGAGGRGNAALIRTEAGRLGYACDILEAVTEAGETVSSTLIRHLLENGELARAEALLKLR